MENIVVVSYKVIHIFYFTKNVNGRFSYFCLIQHYFSAYLGIRIIQLAGYDVYYDIFFGEKEGHTEYEKSIKTLLSQGVRLFTGEFWYHNGENYIENLKKASKFLREKIKTAAK